MRIGILGAGQLATAFAHRALAAGHEVVLSSRRGATPLDNTVRALGDGAHAGTPYQASQEETVVLAVPGPAVEIALASAGPWDGRTLVDATNHLSAPSPLLPGELSTSECVAERAPGAHVVKALNTLLAHVLASRPRLPDGSRRVLFVSGDDLPSKDAFRGLLENMGYATIDLGGLAGGSRLQQFPGGALAGVNLLRTS